MEIEYSLFHTLSERGPWFIGANKLKELDAIFIKHRDQFNLEAKKVADQKLEKEIQAFREDPAYSALSVEKRASLEKDRRELLVALQSVIRSSYKVSLDLGDRKELKGGSFEEIFGDPALLQEKVRGFTAKINSEGFAADVRLTSYNGITIHGYPNGSVEARKVFAELIPWARTVRAPAWRRLWLAFPTPAAIWMWMVFVVTGYYNSYSYPQSELQSQAQKLLDQGVPVAKQKEALDLLLKMSVLKPTLHFAPSFILLAVVTLPLCILLSVQPPRVILGVGDGQERIHSWEKYLKYAFYIIPGFILATFVLPVLQQLVQNQVIPSK